MLPRPVALFAPTRAVAGFGPNRDPYNDTDFTDAVRGVRSSKAAL